MLDIAEELHRWVEQGRTFAVATVVAVGGSAPRQPGAALAVDGEGTAIGSVSGGCVEGAVYDLCVQAIEDGKPVVERFGYSDEDAFAVGLTCGGIIDILVTPVRGGVFPAALGAAATGEAAALARIVGGPDELMGQALLVRPDGSYEAEARAAIAELDRHRGLRRQRPHDARRGPHRHRGDRRAATAAARATAADPFGRRPPAPTHPQAYAFAVPFAALLLLGGHLADRLGGRRTLVVGLTGLVATCLLDGSARRIRSRRAGRGPRPPGRVRRPGDGGGADPGGHGLPRTEGACQGLRRLRHGRRQRARPWGSRPWRRAGRSFWASSSSSP
ncbi:hypothetical protein STANM309S_06070 [Streptomyces tanashiensis]